MPHTNIEFKARVAATQHYEQKLQALSPTFIGPDVQTDTYYNTPNGRLKLREGNIENALIFYNRANTATSKLSDVILYQHQPSSDLKLILAASMGILVQVVKERKIYFVDNVKFHFDNVPTLGAFVEVEAIGSNGVSVVELQAQCDHYKNFLGIHDDMLEAKSYSDLLLEQATQ